MNKSIYTYPSLNHYLLPNGQTHPINIRKNGTKKDDGDSTSYLSNNINV